MLQISMIFFLCAVHLKVVVSICVLRSMVVAEIFVGDIESFRIPAMRGNTTSVQRPIIRVPFQRLWQILVVP